MRVCVCALTLTLNPKWLFIRILFVKSLSNGIRSGISLSEELITELQ